MVINKKQKYNMFVILGIFLLLVFFIFFDGISWISDIVLHSYFKSTGNYAGLLFLSFLMLLFFTLSIVFLLELLYDRLIRLYKGMMGESKVRELLIKWKDNLEERDKVKIYESLKILTLKRDIDFVVINKKGIFFIEVKNWKINPTEKVKKDFKEFIKKFILRTNYFRNNEKYLKNMHFILAKNNIISLPSKISRDTINVGDHSFSYKIVNYEDLIRVIDEEKEVFNDSELEDLFIKFERIRNY